MESRDEELFIIIIIIIIIIYYYYYYIYSSTPRDTLGCKCRYRVVQDDGILRARFNRRKAFFMQKDLSIKNGWR